MRLFFGEAKHRYSQYYFPYQVLLLKEEKDSLEKIYAFGFLPFRNRTNLFYLARSCRVDLAKFSLSSENRRILKKTADFNLEVKTLADFDYTSQAQRQCKDWAKERNWKISTPSLKFIFKGKFFNYIFVWKKDNVLVGYQVIYQKKELIHSGHIFYDVNEAGKDLGMRMLIEASTWAQKEDKKYHYLGTCYSGGRYKRSLSGFEFFNGFSWSTNIQEWKYLDQREKDDYLLRDKEYLEQFWPEGGLDQILKTKGISFKK